MHKEWKASACQGKQQFPSKQAIFKIFTRHGREKPKAYHCAACGFYHVAHQVRHPPIHKKRMKDYNAARKKHYEKKDACPTKT